MTIMRLSRKAAVFVAIALLFAFYIGSYVKRSLGGRYEPASIGLKGVKWYDWAPRGFVTDFRWDVRLMFFYFPLHAADRLWWHKSEQDDDGKYPINEVAPDDIGNVYRAWKR
jgi:hypothetical protein